jgi:uncharacterized protein (TIGR00255 family)
MTGHGEGHCRRDTTSVSVELRTVNSRYLKISTRTPEGYNAFDSQIESLVRKHVRRGTLQVNLRVDRELTADDFRLNDSVISGYRLQLEAIYDQLHINDSIHPESLLSLPGVVDERGGRNAEVQEDWPLIKEALVEALNGLSKMREEEGRAMAADLAENRNVVATELDAIEKQAPQVVDGYRKRLTERLNQMLTEFDVSINASDVVKEVGIFADRADISEEIVRLRSHLEQFDAFMSADESAGRKLEFLTQEMLRETNTIGSKANDAIIARHVIEIKATVERIREMIQNVE